MKRTLLAILVIWILLLSACAAPTSAPTSQPAPPGPPQPPPPGVTYIYPEELSPAETVITEIGKDLAINEMIKGFTDVLDASIMQDGNQVCLVLIVPEETSKTRVEELGFHFVCALIEYELEGGCLEGKRPYPNWITKEPGEGIFDYLITVAAPDQSVIVQGAKVSFSKYISWRIINKAADSPPRGTPSFEPILITGSSDKTSPPFTVTTKEWVIDWSYVPDPEWPEMAVFGFFVYPRGETATFGESVSFAKESGSTYSYAGAGEYYIEVIAANVKSWEVVISPP